MTAFPQYPNGNCGRDERAHNAREYLLFVFEQPNAFANNGNSKPTQRAQSSGCIFNDLDPELIRHKKCQFKVNAPFSLQD